MSRGPSSRTDMRSASRPGARNSAHVRFQPPVLDSVMYKLVCGHGIGVEVNYSFYRVCYYQWTAGATSTSGRIMDLADGR